MIMQKWLKTSANVKEESSFIADAAYGDVILDILQGIGEFLIT